MKTKEEFEEMTKNNGRKNVGWRTDRLSYDPNDIENALSSHWKKENKKEAHINHGQGILQDLFYETEGNPMNLMNPVQRVMKINNRDRLVAATVVQWLGTNCGKCFLNEALKDAGYEIVKTK